MAPVAVHRMSRPDAPRGPPHGLLCSGTGASIRDHARTGPDPAHGEAHHRRQPGGLAATLGGRVRRSTWRGYESLIRLYARPALAEVLLASLRPLHLQSLYADLAARHPKLSAGTILNLHLVLTQALGQAVKWEVIPSSPAAGAQPPRPRRPEPVVVDAALAPRILAAVRGTPMELPATMALCTRMRQGKILALRWSDLDPEFTTASVRRSLRAPDGHLVFCEPKARRPGGRWPSPTRSAPTWSASGRARPIGAARARRGRASTW